MLQGSERDGPEAAPAEEEHDSHELPRGALLLTLSFLLLLTLMWLQVYLQLLNEGGIPR
jgi:cytoskeletal protein RodZ